MPSRVPSATYRLQFNRDFRIPDATAIVDYLHALGITHLYASPLLVARPGSIHGYDVIDHSRLNPELGTEEDLARLADRLRNRDMGLILDVVPNHMCIASPGNQWWLDILENGPGSPAEPFFDIDWRPPKAELADKVLLPFLGDQYGRVLDNQQIQVAYAGGGFVARYGEYEYPLAARTWVEILDPCMPAVTRALGGGHPDLLELVGIVSALNLLPPRHETDAIRVQERIRATAWIRGRLGELVGRSPAVRDSLDASLRDLNGVPGNAGSFDRLDRLLGAQAYRLSYWRVASDEINYRRFFDVNELAALRVENRTVFDTVHAVILRWIRNGWVQGLRIDHVDGLYDPLQYLLDLREAAGEPLSYLVVEKIIGSYEKLRPGWPVHGTTGYDFLNLLNGLFVDPRAEKPLRRAYARITGHSGDFASLAYECKKLILAVSLASEHTVLSRKLDRISEQHRWSRDFTFNSLARALAEFIACFPVYRTYMRHGCVDDEDRRQVHLALSEARRRNPSVSASVFEFIASVLLQEDPPGLDEAAGAERRAFVVSFQQVTPPVMAKAVEDTAFYRHHPLASLNEVGGDPSAFGVAPSLFHQRNEERLRTHPHSMLASSTHDTKRSEDVRARLDGLSEIPRQWEAAVRRWRTMNRRRRTTIDGQPAPRANDEYLFYQAVVGAFDDGSSVESFASRLERYMVKALREAKVHTSWINPNEPYEDAVRSYIRSVLAHPPFLQSLRAFVAPLAEAGRLTSLAQCLLKIACPGVPDFYQGTELPCFTLVDPDNRGPVDYGKRRERLAALSDDKLLVTNRALCFRRDHAALFANGTYHPLEPVGDRAGHIVAFARAHEGRTVIAAAGRFFLSLGSDWGVTSIPAPAADGTWRDVLTGTIHAPVDGGFRAGVLFSRLPVALLDRQT